MQHVSLQNFLKSYFLFKFLLIKLHVSAYMAIKCYNFRIVETALPPLLWFRSFNMWYHLYANVSHSDESFFLLFSLCLHVVPALR
jgi:hypothetical protein